MKAIETNYKGYRFRSRLEAKWAIFFDACGVKWEYEPEGFDLGDGIYYLPDFLLRDVLVCNQGCKKMDLYAEVKGKMTKEDAKKIETFYTNNYSEPMYCEIYSEKFLMGYSIVNPIIILSGIHHGDNIDDIDGIDDYIMSIWNGDESLFPYHEALPFNFATIDGDCWPAYPCININGQFAILEENLIYTERDDESTEKAYRVARQARFEHGQTPLYSLNH